jgi:hypothetical protein
MEIENSVPSTGEALRQAKAVLGLPRASVGSAAREVAVEFRRMQPQEKRKIADFILVSLFEFRD